MAWMLKRFMIDFTPSGGIRQRTMTDKVRGYLRRCDMQHIKGFFYTFYFSIPILDIKIGNPLRTLHLDQIGIEYQIRIVTLHILHQWRHERRHAEQHRRSTVELDINVNQALVSQPMI